MDASAKTLATGVMTMDRLADFGAAWRAGDVDRLMSFYDGRLRVLRLGGHPGRARSSGAGMRSAAGLS